MKFWKILLKNARIHQKLTQNQHNIIQDKCAYYIQSSSKKGLSRIVEFHIIKEFIFIICFLMKLIPIIKPNSFLKKLWDFI